MKTHALTGMLLLAAALSPLAHAQEDKALADALAKINATGASIMPVASDSKNLRFTALNVAKEFLDAGLTPLAAVADKIISLDLARTKVTDAGLVSVAAMKNLTELHLENTGITDKGLDQLKGLSSLEYLNLYGTQVTDAGAAKLAGLKKLKSLYLWQTKVTKAGADSLKKALAGTHVNIGWTAEDDAKPRPVEVPAVAAAPAGAKPGAAPAPAAKPAAAPAPAAPAAAGAKLDAAVAAKVVVFRDVILPILNTKCASCHGEEKSKGKLKLHTFADVMKGGSEGDNVIAGKPDDSLMIKRVVLPTDDDEHMPPSDEPQLTKEETALLRWWITEGANETLTVAAAKKSPDIEATLATILSKGLPKAPTAAAPAKNKPAPLSEEQKKAVSAAAAKMQALGASLMPLALDTEQLRLSVINAADKFADAQLAELSPIAPHILWVDLARSKVTDAGLGTISKMTALERLHLENTTVTDAGIAQLAGLKKLEYLNLYGTKVTDAGIAKLAGNSALKKLFVWQTGVTPAGAKALEAKIPGLVVNVGLSEAEIAKLTAPPPAPPAPPKKEEPKKPEAKKPEAKKEEPKKAASPAPTPAKPAATPAKPEAKK
ncbi:MAG: hypothetical protein JNJ83_07575 [Verrucomicrobiaceae bacterium]|nr:hypothetical protein [Verrucomicrobiaceae bacterium]